MKATKVVKSDRFNVLIRISVDAKTRYCGIIYSIKEDEIAESNGKRNINGEFFAVISTSAPLVGVDCPIDDFMSLKENDEDISVSKPVEIQAPESYKEQRDNFFVHDKSATVVVRSSKLRCFLEISASCITEQTEGAVYNIEHDTVFHNPTTSMCLEVPLQNIWHTSKKVIEGVPVKEDLLLSVKPVIDSIVEPVIDSIIVEEVFTPSSERTKDSIVEITEAIRDLLVEKNKNYGDIAISGVRKLSKISNEKAILVLIENKISRIENSTDLRKNDISDLIGYCVLLLSAIGTTRNDILNLID